MQQLESAYEQLQAAGIYSTSTVQVVGQSLAPYVTADVPYPTFSSKDIKTDSDTSYERMLQVPAASANSSEPPEGGEFRHPSRNGAQAAFFQERTNRSGSAGQPRSPIRARAVARS